MTYRVLIVDDEPIILSGIKYILDWRAHGCEVVATARNGEQALALLDTARPQIVIADIRMPVMDGLELLQRASESHPNIVFIMLTSLEEFQLVKEAMRYHAIEYLLKTELDETVLVRALQAAIAEYENRSNASSHRLLGDLAEEQEGELIAQAIRRIHKSGEVDQETLHLLSKRGMLNAYALVSLAILFPADDEEKHYTLEDRKRLYLWVGEVASKVLPTSAPNFLEIPPPVDEPMRYLWFCYELDRRRWEQQTPSLIMKLTEAVAMVTGLEVALLVTPISFGRESLLNSLNVMEETYDRWYLAGDEGEVTSLGLEGVYTKIEREITGQQVSSFSATIKRIGERIGTRAHRKGQALWMLDGLLASIEGAIAVLEGSSKAHTLLHPFKEKRPYLTQRSDLLGFLGELEDMVLPLLGSASSEKLQIVSRAKQYIQSSVQKKIMLQDVADAAFVSAGYLSSLFKQITGQNVVDYINECKVEEAKRLMEGGMSRVSEMALALCFENIYYFSKVFKRVQGIPPTHYLRRLEAERASSTSTDSTSRQDG